MKTVPTLFLSLLLFISFSTPTVAQSYDKEALAKQVVQTAGIQPGDAVGIIGGKPGRRGDPDLSGWGG